MRKSMKSFSILLAITFIIAIFSFPAMGTGSESAALLGRDNVRRPSEAGALSVEEVDGQMTLVDASGAPIQLRGMSTHGLQWFGEIINPNAFAALSQDWESNVIRLAMYVGEQGYATNPAVKDLVYEGIELAFENDMYVIVDWHVHAPGDPNEAVYSGAYDFFDELSAHYQNHPQYDSIIWEICNEPSPNSSGGQGVTNDAAGWSRVKEYAEPIVELLRQRGDNIIIVGTPNWSQRPDLAADNPIDANNVMYAVHFYTGTHFSSDNSTDRGNVMSNARYALENGAAVFATEWGVSEASGDNGPYLEEADIWIEYLNSNNISWVNWSLTNKNETSGSFIPYIMGISDATNLDPGNGQVWSIEEMSVSGEYVRARIKGIEYDPIDRSPEGSFEEAIWTFDDHTTQGFVINRDSPVTSVQLGNADGMLMLTNMTNSKDVTETNFWVNVRISSDDFDPEVDIYGADTITMDVFVDYPTVVSIACVPQSEQNSWANPYSAIRLYEDDFSQHSNGRYHALMTMTADQAANLGVIATDPDGSVLSNMVIFVGSSDGSNVYLDNITFSGGGASAAPSLEHDPIGTAQLPSDFEDGTRQGWDWSVDSGTKVNLTIQEANGSPSLAFEFAYPDVKPSDNWASAPRLDLWLEPLVRGDNDYVIFDAYLSPTRASTGVIDICVAFQPPEQGYWAQPLDLSYQIELENIGEAEMTSDGLYHYRVYLDIRAIDTIDDDTQLRNMLLIFADLESDFSGTIFVDNIRMATQSEVDAWLAADAEVTPESDEEDVVVDDKNDTEQDDSRPMSMINAILIAVIAGVLGLVVIIVAVVVVIVFVVNKKKPSKQESVIESDNADKKIEPESKDIEAEADTQEKEPENIE